MVRNGTSAAAVIKHFFNRCNAVRSFSDVAAVDVGVEEVLDLPLDATDLAEQASRLLEEHDLNNVLNQIPADAFNDLFIGNSS